MTISTIRLEGNLDRLTITAHKSDGSNSIIVAKIVNKAGLRRVLKSHAKFYGLTVAADGYSAYSPCRGCDNPPLLGYDVCAACGEEGY